MANQFMLMEPKNENFNELIGNSSKYSVPRFQRDYAWDIEQWEDLWNDIVNRDIEGFHYMGYMVVQQKEQYLYEVIDGQQRLVTLSIIVLAAMRAIKQLIEQKQEIENNETRLNELQKRFIGTKNIVTLQVENKFVLNRNNKDYFQKLCDEFDTPNPRGLTATNKLIKKCFDFFKSKDFGQTGADIASFILSFANSMVFTKIVVQDEINAYKVFETLNARGVQLSTPDLLKNYLFSVVARTDDVSEKDLDDLDSKWSEMINQLGESDLSDFIRYHHNFKNKLVTKKDLFSVMRKDVGSSTEAYKYVNDLIAYAPIYSSLLNPIDIWWQGQDPLYKACSEHLAGIRLFNIRQPLSILMPAFKRFTPEEFVKIVKYIYVLSIRYNVVCHMSPSDQEQQYNMIAMKIHSGEFKRASHVKNSEEFRKLYPDDRTFKVAFEGLKMPSRQTAKKIRHILAEIETHLGHVCSPDTTTLEHISPYNPVQKGVNMEDAKDRLGNMLLLNKDILGRQNFDEKKEYYKTTPFKLAEKVVTYQKWDMDTVIAHQRWMAEKAADTWCIQYDY